MRVSPHLSLVAVALVAVAVALASCAGPSQYGLASPATLMSRLESPESYGYLDKRLSDRTYRVSYFGPTVRTGATDLPGRERAGRRAEETAYDLALWRASKITLDNGYGAFTVTESTAELNRYIVGRDYTGAYPPTMTGVFILAAGFYSATYYNPHVTLSVEMLDAPSQDAFDARETAERIERKYAEVGQHAIGPDTYYYFGPSAYLHDLGLYEEEGIFKRKDGAPERRKSRY